MAAAVGEDCAGGGARGAASAAAEAAADVQPAHGEREEGTRAQDQPEGNDKTRGLSNRMLAR